MATVPRFALEDFRLGDTVELICKLSKGGQPFPTDSITNIWFTLKRGQNDPDSRAIIQKTLDSGITITDSTTGELLITLTPTDTRGINAPQTLQADLQIKDSDGRVTTVCQGTMRFEFDITRSI